MARVAASFSCSPLRLGSLTAPAARRRNSSQHRARTREARPRPSATPRPRAHRASPVDCRRRRSRLGRRERRLGAAVFAEGRGSIPASSSRGRARRLPPAKAEHRPRAPKDPSRLPLKPPKVLERRRRRSRASDPPRPPPPSGQRRPNSPTRSLPSKRPARTFAVAEWSARAMGRLRPRSPETPIPAHPKRASGGCRHDPEGQTAGHSSRRRQAATASAGAHGGLPLQRRRATLSQTGWRDDAGGEARSLRGLPFPPERRKSTCRRPCPIPPWPQAAGGATL